MELIFLILILQSPLPVVLILSLSMMLSMIQVLKREKVFLTVMSGKATTEEKIEACKGLIWIMAMGMTYICFVIFYGIVPILWVVLYLALIALAYKAFKRKP